MHEIVSALTYYRKNLFKKPEILFATVAVLSTIAILFVLPSKLVIPDENMHFLRAYDMSSFRLDCAKADNGKCLYPSVIVEKSFDQVYRNDYDPAVDGQKINNDDEAELWRSTAHPYAPLVHVPQAAGILVAKTINNTPNTLILFARLANALLYIVAIYFIIKKVRLGKWVFAVVALLPTMLMQAVSVSGDAVNNVVVLAFIAFLINIFTQTLRLSRKQLILAVVFASALALTKNINIILFLPLLFLPARLFGEDGRTQLRKWLFVSICFVLFGATYFVWQILADAPSVTIAEILYNPIEAAKIIFRTFVLRWGGDVSGISTDYGDLVLRGVIGDFASFRYHLPAMVVVTQYTLLAIALLYGASKEYSGKISRSFAAVSTLTFAGLIAAVTFALYSSWATQPYRLGGGALYADGVQGRYFSAFLPLLIPLFYWIQRYLNIKIRSEAVMGILVAVVALVGVGFYIFETVVWFDVLNLA